MAPPTPVDGSPTVRFFDGVDDRLLGAPNLGSDWFINLTFWRANTNLPPDNLVSQRFLTQYAHSPLKPRLAVGINRGKLAIVMELRLASSSGVVGVVRMFESDIDMMDTNKHTLGVWVQGNSAIGGSEVIVFLDGKEAMHWVTTHVDVAPETTGARRIVNAAQTPICFGSDSGQRNFHGYMDDIACYNLIFQPTPQQVLDLHQYLRAVENGVTFRSYTGAPFQYHVGLPPRNTGGAAAWSQWVIVPETGLNPQWSDPNPPAYEFVSKPGTSAENARSALASPFSTDLNFPEQVVEFKFTAGSEPIPAHLAIGITSSPTVTFNGGHLGETSTSYSYLPDGRVRHNNSTVAGGLPTWGFSDYVAMKWTAATGQIKFYKGAVEVYSFTPGGGPWYPAARFGNNGVTVASGNRAYKNFPQHTLGVPWVAPRGVLTSEFMGGRPAPLACTLQETGTTFASVGTTTAIGTSSAAVIQPSITGDPNETSRLVGTLLEFNTTTLAAPRDQFFYGLAFSPTASDLSGIKVLLGTINPADLWGIQLVSGSLQAWVGGVTVSIPTGQIVAGGKYYVGIDRSPTGKLRMWLSGNWVAQSTAQTVVTGVLSRKIAVGYGQAGVSKFEGSVSHVIISNVTMPAWRLARIAQAGAWTVANHLAVTGDFVPVEGKLTGALTISGPGAPYSVAVTAGTAPPGITFSVSGNTVIASGTATVSGAYTWTLTVTNSSSATAAIVMSAVSVQVPWEPALVPSIYTMFNDTSSVVTSAQGLSQWNPVIGTYPYAQSVGGARYPQAVPQGMSNNRRTVKFDGVDDFLSMSDTGARTFGANTSAMWAFGVWRITKEITTGNMVPMAFGDSSSNSRFTISIEVNTAGTGMGYRLRGRRIPAEAEGAMNDVPLTSPRTWHMWYAAIDFQNNVFYFSINGGPTVQQSGVMPVAGLTHSANANRSPTLGAWPSVANAMPTIAAAHTGMEVAAFTAGQGGLPTASEIQRLFGWAAHRYSLTALLPSNHPYKNTPPVV